MKQIIFSDRPSSTSKDSGDISRTSFSPLFKFIGDHGDVPGYEVSLDIQGAMGSNFKLADLEEEIYRRTFGLPGRVLVLVYHLSK